MSDDLSEQKETGVDAGVPLGISRRGLVARNAIWSLAGWVCVLLLGFVASPVLIKSLGKTHYGLYILLSSLIAPLGLFDFGVGEATVKHVAESLGRGDQAQAERFLRSTLFFNLLVGVGGALLVWAAAHPLVASVFNVPSNEQATATLCVYALGATWACNQVSQTYMGAMMAIQEYRLLSVVSLCIQGGTLAGGAVAAVISGQVEKVIFVQTLIAACGTAAWWIFTKQHLPGFCLAPSFDKPSLKVTFGFGAWQTFNKLGGLLAQRAQLWILGAFLTAAVVGYFSLALQIAVVVYLITYKIGQVLFPMVSRLQGEGEEEEAARLTVLTTWLCGVAGLALLVTTALFANEFLSLWIGAEVAQEIAPVMRILLVHVAISMMFAIPNFYLLGTGKVQWLAWLAIGQGLVVVGAGWWLTPRFGIQGAAWSVVMGSVPQVVVLIMLWRRLLSRWISAAEYIATIFAPILLTFALIAFYRWIWSLISFPLGWVSLGSFSMVVWTISAAVLVGATRLLRGGDRRWAFFKSAMDSVLLPLKTKWHSRFF